MMDKGENSDSVNSDSDSSGSDFNSDCDNGSDNENLNTTLKETDETDGKVTSVDATEVVDKYVEISDNMRASHPDKEKSTAKQLQDFVSDKSHSSTLDKNIIDVKDIVANVIQESRLLGEDNDINEPDIVRSTKTRTPPSTLQATASAPEPKEEVNPTESDVKVTDADMSAEPKPPPRRKKKLHVVTDRLSSNTEMVDITVLFVLFQLQTCFQTISSIQFKKSIKIVTLLKLLCY